MTTTPPSLGVDVAGERVVEAIKLSCDPSAEFPAAVAAGLGAVLALAAAEPTLIHDLFAPSDDLAVLERQERWREALADELRRVAASKGPKAVSVPPSVEGFLIGGLGFYALRYVRDSGAEGLERLAPELLILVLCCYYPTPIEAKAAAQRVCPEQKVENLD